MVVWALADVVHTFSLMPLFPPGTFPIPDSYIIVIVLYHAVLGIGIGWVAYGVVRWFISIFNLKSSNLCTATCFLHCVWENHSLQLKPARPGRELEREREKKT